MARKPTTKSEFVLFDVFYDDDTRRSNRRVPKEILEGLDGDEPARAYLEAQDREIADRARRPMPTITMVKRSD